MSQDLLKEIRTYLAKTGLTPGSFGKIAVANGRLVERLEAGDTITLRTAERIRAFIRDNPDKRGRTRREAAE